MQISEMKLEMNIFFFYFFDKFIIWTDLSYVKWT